MKLLMDTSAIIKRYRDEHGRERVEALFERALVVAMAAHCKVEIASGLCRDLHDQLITQDEYNRVMRVVHGHFADFKVMGLTGQVEALAIAAMESNRLRAMDALHIGAAQAAQVDLFVTADKRQALAAQSCS